MSGNVKKEVPT